MKISLPIDLPITTRPGCLQDKIGPIHSQSSYLKRKRSISPRPEKSPNFPKGVYAATSERGHNEFNFVNPDLF